jgi:hypothetical protein
MWVVSLFPLETLIQRAYLLSAQYAPGILHRREGDLDLETVELIKNSRSVMTSVDMINMHHVYGRIVRLMIIFFEGDMYVNESWPEHTNEQVQALVAPLEEVEAENE